MDKERHGFVTFWLWLMIIANAGTALFHFFQSDYAIWVYATEENAKLFFYVKHNMVDFFQYGMIALGVFALVNACAATLLLKWKKLGFWLFVSMVTANFAIMVIFAINGGMTQSVIQSMIGAIAGPVILWAILQIKKNGISCWKQLD